jgi:hypothetical protein
MATVKREVSKINSRFIRESLVRKEWKGSLEHEQSGFLAISAR